MNEKTIDNSKMNVIYLAGGCFWGMEKLFKALPGVKEVTSGYANGVIDNPTYELVCKGDTGFKETIKVEYDSNTITLEQLLSAYFLVIDPCVKNQQGHDIGAQYQTGVYYTDNTSGKIVKSIFNLEAKRYEAFYVEQGMLKNFYDAEEYHQDYLDKNPNGYCHIPNHKIEDVVAIIKAEQSWSKPDEDELKKTLTQEQYAVTQNAKTEKPFTGAYCDSFDKGIYVDIVTGQPLFSSKDKYDSGCGWPSFTVGILAGSFKYNEDDSFGMIRTEVVSANGQSHLGHVFEGDQESANGVRYCMNSSSIRFIPLGEMEAEGYGAYLPLLK